MRKIEWKLGEWKLGGWKLGEWKLGEREKKVNRKND